MSGQKRAGVQGKGRPEWGRPVPCQAPAAHRSCHKHLITLYQSMDTKTGFYLLTES